ncbi:hypothetical protein ROZALSC1DRAFT_26946 [Rozella allomycis CSF55]|uniref:Uncharacterized protein n=1 Tax=Rozella allomycis (strain CSF55) TaxID=988480 RepID=A0A075B168_ROZAC|nr:hypothetical protein O9G_005950 [Rozella allomycis CSF55]RKP21660.1 hypothetical protein ROZALSC1DRAFT_26946 [Rozella allomycis CSF55]|eukprot:EPZ36329.1 hypothetical protein O9G_005950 [Rozella allomycis CSF55]
MSQAQIDLIQPTETSPITFKRPNLKDIERQQEIISSIRIDKRTAFLLESRGFLQNVFSGFFGMLGGAFMYYKMRGGYIGNISVMGGALLGALYGHQFSTWACHATLKYRIPQLYSSIHLLDHMKMYLSDEDKNKISAIKELSTETFNNMKLVPEHSGNNEYFYASFVDDQNDPIKNQAKYATINK